MKYTVASHSRRDLLSQPTCVLDPVDEDANLTPHKALALEVVTWIVSIRFANELPEIARIFGDGARCVMRVCPCQGFIRHARQPGAVRIPMVIQCVVPWLGQTGQACFDDFLLQVSVVFVLVGRGFLKFHHVRVNDVIEVALVLARLLGESAI